MEIKIKNVVVNCRNGNGCGEYNVRLFHQFTGTTVSDGFLKKKMRIISETLPIDRLFYRIVKSGNDNFLHVDVRFKRMIRNIKFNFGTAENLPILKRQLPYKEGDYYREQDNKKACHEVEKILSKVGIDDTKASVAVSLYDNVVDLEFNVNVAGAVIVSDIMIITKSVENVAELKLKFARFKGKKWDKIRFKVKVDQIARELFRNGYFFSSTEILPPEKIKNGNEVILKIKVDYGRKFNMSFIGNTIFHRKEMMAHIRSVIKKGPGKLMPRILKKVMVEYYESVGVYNTQVVISTRDGKTSSGTDFVNYYFLIKEGKKIFVKKPVYKGNSFFSRKFLDLLYQDHASVIASRGYLDRNFLEKFRIVLKDEYLKSGFIFVEVSMPRIIVLSQGGSSAFVDYDIMEGKQCIVKKININNVGPELQNEIKNVLGNKENRPFNVKSVQEDLEKILRLIREKGYLFGQIINIDPDSVVSYNAAYTGVVINVDLKLGKIAKFNSVFISGNVQTKSKVIEREIDLKKGDIITSTKLEAIRDGISYLGLFSAVQILPVIVDENSSGDSSLVNFLVKVKEVDFGVWEIAPGYRTDIGVKVSSSVTYNNLMGMNRSASMMIQANQRQDLSSLDIRRRSEEDKKIEYSSRLDYNEPYLFGLPLGFNTLLSGSRKRFYGFDADIFKLSFRISKSFFDFLNLSIRYQLENIKQFDASEEKDNGRFRIGGVTPSISFDFRDDNINPKKGMFFGLSLELANPEFGSMKQKDGEVDFYKFISRNKFYIPVQNWVLAISASWGIEKNLVAPGGNVGYIPSIKVFRLNGVDIVRGFDDGEINRISSGDDINSVTIDGKAYFMNVKMESRYNINKDVVIAPFFDAGRLYVNNYEPTRLRKSVGLSIKMLTPVGSLDFDYGIKLNRKSWAETGKESFGRFHLSIGLF